MNRPLASDSHDMSLVSRNKVIHRWDYHFYARKYLEVIEKLEALSSTQLHTSAFTVPLSHLSILVSQKFDPNLRDPEDTFQYVEIGGVNVHTGEAIPTEMLVREAPSRAKYVVRTDDIIVSTVRPSRNAVALITRDLDGAVVSSGFAVLRVKEHTNPKSMEYWSEDKPSVAVTPHYLFSYMKSDLARLQLERLTTASMYPTFSRNDLLQILVLVFRDTTGFAENIVRESQRVFQMMTQIGQMRRGITQEFNSYLDTT